MSLSGINYTKFKNIFKSIIFEEFFIFFKTKCLKTSGSKEVLITKNRTGSQMKWRRFNFSQRLEWFHGNDGDWAFTKGLRVKRVRRSKRWVEGLPSQTFTLPTPSDLAISSSSTRPNSQKTVLSHQQNLLSALLTLPMGHGLETFYFPYIVFALFVFGQRAISSQMYTPEASPEV